MRRATRTLDASVSSSYARYTQTPRTRLPHGQAWAQPRSRHLTTSSINRADTTSTTPARPATNNFARSATSNAAPRAKPSTPLVNTASETSPASPQQTIVPHRSLTESLSDPPPQLSEDEKQVDWTRSFHGLSAAPFSPEASAILTQEIPFDDIEIKPDGIIYLPEIKYRRILNKAFGPGGWGLVPRGETIVTEKLVTREYALVCAGRLVSIARGEMQYFDPDGIPTATEGCKSNALMRCCKDLGIASELWDPRFIKRFLASEGRETIVEHMTNKKRRKHFMRKDDTIKYPFKDVGSIGGR